MKIEFDANTPIYQQIVEALKKQLASGGIGPGERIAPVRELAVALGVNPNTLQRALSELERDGLLRSERTSGRFATDDEKRLRKLKEDLSQGEVSSYVHAMGELGFDGKEAAQAVHDYVERNTDDGSTQN